MHIKDLIHFNEYVRLKGIVFDRYINDRILAMINQTELSEVMYSTEVITDM
jgi:hypothetical protein